VEGVSYRDLLNAHELKCTRRVLLLFEAQGDHLACALHQGVEAFSLSAASAKGGNRSNQIARLVSFDYDGELSTGRHTLPRVPTLSRFAFGKIGWEETKFTGEGSIEAMISDYFFSGFLAK
jgi:hypothetical protein